jgi:hypothetical protein
VNAPAPTSHGPRGAPTAMNALVTDAVSPRRPHWRNGRTRRAARRPADQERFPIETAAGELPILQSILSVAPACVSSGRD